MTDVLRIKQLPSKYTIKDIAKLVELSIGTFDRKVFLLLFFV